jgi:ribose transport system substrate-binding protein
MFSVCKMDRQCTTAFLLVAALLLLPGCKGSDDAPDPGGNEAKTVIGVCQSSLDDPWRVQISADMEAAAKKHPELDVAFEDAGGDAAKQQQQVEKFVADGAAAIVISPVASQALTEPVAQAMAAGIPVIVLHTPLIGDDYTCLLQVDNVRIGEAAGAWLADRLGGKGRIVELKGPVDSPAAKGRHEGFLAAIRKHPEMRVLRDYPTEGKEAVAAEEMAKALEAFDGIDAVFAHHDAAAHGAYLAAEKAGRRDEMLIVGVGGLPEEGSPYVRDGQLDACFQHPTGGAEAIDLAAQAVEGKEVPKSVTLDTRVFTSEAVETGGAGIETQQP